MLSWMKRTRQARTLRANSWHSLTAHRVCLLSCMEPFIPEWKACHCHSSLNSCLHIECITRNGPRDACMVMQWFNTLLPIDIYSISLRIGSGSYDWGGHLVKHSNQVVTWMVLNSITLSIFKQCLMGNKPIINPPLRSPSPSGPHTISIWPHTRHVPSLHSYFETSLGQSTFNWCHQEFHITTTPHLGTRL